MCLQHETYDVQGCFMKPIFYKSTNNPNERINFETALLRGLAPDYGLYTVPREEIPVLSAEEIAGMKGKTSCGSPRGRHILSRITQPVFLAGPSTIFSANGA
jgi:threonine synthase